MIENQNKYIAHATRQMQQNVESKLEKYSMMSYGWRKRVTWLKPVYVTREIKTKRAKNTLSGEQLYILYMLNMILNIQVNVRNA